MSCLRPLISSSMLSARTQRRIYMDVCGWGSGEVDNLSRLLVRTLRANRGLWPPRFGQTSPGGLCAPGRNAIWIRYPNTARLDNTMTNTGPNGWSTLKARTNETI